MEKMQEYQSERGQTRQETDLHLVRKCDIERNLKNTSFMVAKNYEKLALILIIIYIITTILYRDLYTVFFDFV